MLGGEEDGGELDGGCDEGGLEEGGGEDGGGDDEGGDEDGGGDDEGGGEVGGGGEELGDLHAARDSKTMTTASVLTLSITPPLRYHQSRNNRFSRGRNVLFSHILPL